MTFAIKVTKTEDGRYSATIDKEKFDGGAGINPCGIVQADSAFEAYGICKRRIEAKGHTIVEI